MMRLIDADALTSRWCGMKCGCEREECGREIEPCITVMAIEEAPTIDAVEVVRCRHCKWCELRMTANYIPFYYCLSDGISVKDTDYCSYGEREGERCGNCKFLTYRWGKVWCDIMCDTPMVEVCDKWKRSNDEQKK